MKYRSRADIVSQILEAANGGATKTKIMYKSYVSFAQLREYLALLTEKGLIEFEAVGSIFRNTEKGLRVLNMCNNINEELVITQK